MSAVGQYVRHKRKNYVHTSSKNTLLIEICSQSTYVLLILYKDPPTNNPHPFIYNINIVVRFIIVIGHMSYVHHNKT